MSEPKRYNVEEIECCFQADMVEHSNGEYVKYDDYARLKEEAERYRLASIRVDVGELHAQFNRALFDVALAENARLKAEVERLTKAGDAMAKLMFIDKDYIGSPKQEVVVEWCKATEGKQS